MKSHTGKKIMGMGISFLLLLTLGSCLTTDAQKGSVAGAGVGALWLDGRNMTAHGGGMTLRSAVIDAEGELHARPTSEGLVDPRVCDCCVVFDACSVLMASGSPSREW